MNSTTALVNICINYKNDFKENDLIICDIKLLKWVDEFVFNYFIERISNKSFLYFNNIIEIYDLQFISIN